MRSRTTGTVGMGTGRIRATERAWRWRFVPALCLCFVTGAAATAPAPAAPARGVDFQALLDEAGKVKTSDVARFEQLLGRMQAISDRASQEQRHRLAILLAYRHALRGESKDAVALLKEVLAESPVAAVRFEAGGLLSNTHAANRAFEDALRIIEEILLLRDQVADLETRHRGMLNAGVVYNQVGEFALGRRLATAVLDSDPGARNRCAAENLVAESTLGLQEPLDEARLRANIVHCDAIDEQVFAAFARAHLAQWLGANGRFNAAIAVLQQYLPTLERIRYPFIHGLFHALLADFRLREGAEAEAEAHANTAIERARALGGIEPVVSAHRTLYRIAQGRGDPAATLHAYQAFVEVERRHLEDVKSREMAYQIVRHQSQQQTQQIELLNQRNALLELDRTANRQRARLWLVVAGLLSFLLATTGYWAFKNKRLQMRLRRLAELDPLTGVSNRHHFSDRAGRVLGAARQEHRVVALVTFDLDHFKQINDRYGHAAGDWALEQVAAVCAVLCGPADCMARMGGEEFAMLLPGCDAATGRSVAEDALAALDGIDTASRGYGFRVGASFGVTDTTLSGYDLNRLLSHADRAMYAAKRGGRSRVVVFDEDSVRQLMPRGEGATDLRPAEDGRRSLPV